MAAVPPVPAQPVLVDQVWFPGNDYITFHGSESHTERRWLRAVGNRLPFRESKRLNHL